MKTKELEVFITKTAAKEEYGCGEYFFKEEIGYEGKLLKAKLIVEIPEKKIEITESDLARAWNSMDRHSPAIEYDRVAARSEVFKDLKKRLGFDDD